MNKIESGCEFIKPWRGRCGKEPTENNPKLCDKHADKSCRVCGSPAVTECDLQTLGLMCGAPLCDKHDNCGNH